MSEYIEQRNQNEENSTNEVEDSHYDEENNDSEKTIYENNEKKKCEAEENEKREAEEKQKREAEEKEKQRLEAELEEKKKREAEDEKKRLEAVMASLKFKVGERVSANWGGSGKFYSATIKSINANATYNLNYDDGGIEDGVKEKMLKSLKKPESPEQINPIEEMPVGGKKKMPSPKEKNTKGEAKNEKKLLDAVMASLKFKVGERVSANWGGSGKFYSATVKSINANATYNLNYDDGGIEDGVKEKMLKSLNKPEPSKQINPIEEMPIGGKKETPSPTTTHSSGEEQKPWKKKKKASSNTGDNTGSEKPWKKNRKKLSNTNESAVPEKPWKKQREKKKSTFFFSYCVLNVTHLHV